MSLGWFVTGTDTGIGKTRVSTALLAALGAHGICAVGMKPVASGARTTPEGLRNDDAERLLAASGVPVSYADINPYVFAPSVAPHLAAAAAGVVIRLPAIHAAFERLRASAEAVVVEGVGGWLVPLDEQVTVADLAQSLGLPVILVVGMRLGCLNHALLSAQMIRASGLPLVGWVANVMDPDFELLAENVASLNARLSAPLLGMLPWTGEAPFDANAAGAHLALSLLGLD